MQAGNCQWQTPNPGGAESNASISQFRGPAIPRRCGSGGYIRGSSRSGSVRRPRCVNLAAPSSGWSIHGRARRSRNESWSYWRLR